DGLSAFFALLTTGLGVVILWYALFRTRRRIQPLEMAAVLLAMAAAIHLFVTANLALIWLSWEVMTGAVLLGAIAARREVGTFPYTDSGRDLFSWPILWLVLLTTLVKMGLFPFQAWVSHGLGRAAAAAALVGSLCISGIYVMIRTIIMDASGATGAGWTTI